MVDHGVTRITWSRRSTSRDAAIAGNGLSAGELQYGPEHRHVGHAAQGRHGRDGTISNISTKTPSRTARPAILLRLIPAMTATRFEFTEIRRNRTSTATKSSITARKAIEITTRFRNGSYQLHQQHITGNGGPSIDQYPSSAADLEWTGNTVSGNGPIRS